MNTFKEGVIANSVVAESVSVGKECETAEGVVELAGAVIDHRVYSHSRVLGAGAIEQKRCRANCRV